MKKTICLWALLLIVVSCTNDDNYNDEHGDKAVIPPKGRIIRIMTYNIYGARATSPANAADLDALAEVIRRQDPDFVTLNEVDVFTNRTGKDVHQARDLAAKLGMEWHFSKAIDRDGGEYGDAVLSKHPIIETRSYRLPCAASQPGEDRSLCVIRVEIDGKDLYVASTHLDHLSGDASRLVQANEIRRIRDTELDGDLILAGDLNAIPEFERHRHDDRVPDQCRERSTNTLSRRRIPPARSTTYCMPRSDTSAYRTAQWFRAATSRSTASTPRTTAPSWPTSGSRPRKTSRRIRNKAFGR